MPTSRRELTICARNQPKLLGRCPRVRAPLSIPDTCPVRATFHGNLGSTTICPQPRTSLADRSMPLNSKPSRQFLFVAFLQPCSCCRSGRPNIVFILADDLGYTDLGLHGQQLLRDAEYRSAGGRRLDVQPRLHVRPELPAHPRGADQRPVRSAHGRLHRRQHRPLRLAEPAACAGRQRHAACRLIRSPLPMRFKPAGYATGMFGKWHLGQRRRASSRASAVSTKRSVRLGRHFNFATDPKTDSRHGCLSGRFSHRPRRRLHSPAQGPSRSFFTCRICRALAAGGQEELISQFRDKPTVWRTQQSGLRRDDRQPRRKRGARAGRARRTRSGRKHAGHLLQRQWRRRRLRARRNSSKRHHRQRSAARRQRHALRRRRSRAVHLSLDRQDCTPAATCQRRSIRSICIRRCWKSPAAPSPRATRSTAHSYAPLLTGADTLDRRSRTPVLAFPGLSGLGRQHLAHQAGRRRSALATGSCSSSSKTATSNSTIWTTTR